MNKWEKEASKTEVAAAAPVATVAPQATATAAPKVADAPVAETGVAGLVHKIENELADLAKKVGV